MTGSPEVRADSTHGPPPVDRPLSEADFEDLVQEVRHRMDAARDEQARLRLLVEAVVTMAADLDLDSVLARIVTIASRLVDARYAVLEIRETGPGQRRRTFTHHGIGDEVVAEVDALPADHGVISLVQHPVPRRPQEPSGHWTSRGERARQAPTDSVLEVPVRLRSTVFGNLYLAEKGGGVDFTPEDEEIVIALAGAAGVVIENARLYEEAARRERWLQATADMTSLLSESASTADALAIVVDLAQAAAEADVAWIATGSDPARLGIRSVKGAHSPTDDVLMRGLGSDALRGITEDGEMITIEDLGGDDRLFPDGPPAGWPTLRSVVVVQLGPSTGLCGALGLAWTPERADRHRTLDQQMPMGFARQAALALQVLRAREDQFRLAVLEDRDRIARDLHDLVIQRLFALGLRLEVVAPRADPVIGRRLGEAVDELDTTIKDIRRTIFALGSSDPTENVLVEVNRIVDRASATFRFRPELRFDGPVTLIPQELVPDLLAVVSEALSNASRHADASMVQVTLSVSDQILLTVIDDGLGMPEVVSEGGLANLRHRAEHHGGALTVGSTRGRGTTLRWAVPLP